MHTVGEADPDDKVMVEFLCNVFVPLALPEPETNTPETLEAAVAFTAIV
jgi:hypothetical protein